MSTTQDIERGSESLKQLRRALFYESQFRNAILSDAVSFYDANITKDSIENEFFFRDEENDFISIPDFIGFSTPCKFSDFIERWCYAMVPDMSQKALRDIPNLRQTLLKVFEEGKREYVLNYWGESVSGKKVYFNHQFLLTKNELDEVCALSIIKDYTQMHAIDDEYMHSELELLAYQDPITQGYNYIKFKEKLKEDGRPGSIICLDIHSFKIINSICGVSKGDEVIKNIWDALIISLDMDKGDLAAHINADHFIIFLPTTDKDVIVHKLKNLSLSLIVISVDLDIPQLQPYFGVSRWDAGKKIEMAYSEAITAKHNAKQQQNVDYAFFDEAKKVSYSRIFQEINIQNNDANISKQDLFVNLYIKDGEENSITSDAVKIGLAKRESKIIDKKVASPKANFGKTSIIEPIKDKNFDFLEPIKDEDEDENIIY